MRDLLTTLDEWGRSDPAIAMATVVRTAGSTPRPAGARLLVDAQGRMDGSVSGGCLEAAVVLEAQETLAGRAQPRMLGYGISDEMGWNVGLSCGGSVDIFVETLRWDGSDPVLAALRDALIERREAVLLSVVDGPAIGARAVVVEGSLVGSLGDPELDDSALVWAAERLRSGDPALEQRGVASVFVDPQVPQPVCAIVGGVHIAAPLSTMARVAGYRVVIVDPRTAFLTAERFPDADQLIASWPDKGLPPLHLGPRDAGVCLSHDPKFDEPTLATLLGSQVGYVGAIGSRRTHDARVARLREAGFDDSDIARVHSPIGLDIGSRTPAEIALAILAEMVAVRRGRDGASLRQPLAAGTTV